MKCFSSLIEIDLYGWSTGTTCSLLLYIFDSESHTGGDSALSSSSSFCECSKRCSAQKNVTDQIVLIGSSGAVFSGSVWICSCRVANFRSVSNLSFNGSCPRSSRFQKAVSQQLNEYRISLHSVYCAASPVSLQEIPFHGRLGVARNLFYGGIKLLILIVDSVTVWRVAHNDSMQLMWMIADNVFASTRLRNAGRANDTSFQLQARRPGFSMWRLHVPWNKQSCIVTRFVVARQTTDY